MLKATDRSLPTEPSDPIRVASFEDDEVQEMIQEEEPEPVKIVDVVAGFDEILVWGHDELPTEEENVFCKGLNEWMAFAEEIHRPPIKPKEVEEEDTTPFK